MCCRREQAQEVGQDPSVPGNWLIVYRRKITNGGLRDSVDQEIVIPQPISAPSVNFNTSQRTNPQNPALHQGAPLLQGQTPSGPAQSDLALPAYITPLPDRFGPDDVTYLRNKGALAIPDDRLRDELLQCYAVYMHPLMPLLDLQSFLQIVEQNDGAHTVSLLLFQAVMFSGIATADIHTLEASGYSNRREARRTFFNRIRLLYDLDYEDDSIALVQALLLMTYWREEPHARKETHHWIEIAVSLSQKIGLNHNPEQSGHVAASQKLRRRIWWSAYVRDVQIALGTRRPTRIHDVDFDVPMLQMADFQADTSFYVDRLVRVPDKQQQLAILCIEQTKLCLRISHILATQYGVTSSKGSRRTSTILFPDSLQPGDEDLQATDKALQEWKDKLPDSVRLNLPSPQNMDSSDSCLIINCAALHMFYYAGLSCLHRLQLLRSSTKLPDAARSSSTDYFRKALRLAAIKITVIAGTLLNLNLVRYLPSATITVLLPAIVYHLSRALSLEHSIRHKSLQYYCICMQVMAALRDMYAAADYSTAFLQAAIQRTGIGPMTPQTEDDKNAYNALTNAQDLIDINMPVNSPDSSLSSRSLAVSPYQVTGLATGQNNNDNLVTPHNIHHRPSASLVSADSPSEQDRSQFQYGQQVPTYMRNSTFDAWSIANGTSPTNLTRSDASGTIDNRNDLQLAFAAMQGQGGEFPLDSDWLSSIGAEELMIAGFDGDATVF